MKENNLTNHYNLIVLGSGPAGEKGAAQAAYFGKKVALIEQDKFLGGSAASTAISSKTLRETSLALSGIKSRRLHGVDLSLKRQAKVEDFLYHERAVKEGERTRIMNNMKKHNINIFKGLGSFDNKHCIKITSKNNKTTYLTGDIVLIATGSKPRRPENCPTHKNIYDSDTILHINEIPKKMVVIGGGVIGCEYACIFAALGVNISLIHNKDVLLPFVDRDISLTLEKRMLKMGINLLLSDKIKKYVTNKKTIEIILDSGKICTTDTIMLATGRTSNTEELNLKSAGIIPGKYGLLVVNSNYQVIHPETKKCVSNIYAAGDVIGRPALASTAMEQARFAMIKAFNLEPYKKHVAPILPTGIYTIPECSMAGKTEKECQNEGIDYIIGKATYDSNARGMIIGDSDGFLKLLFEYNNNIKKPMKLLGIQIIGEIASELIHIGINALIMNAKSNVFIETCFNYPTLGELYKYATYDAMGKRIKRLKQT